jgi:hypothetical protein
MSKGEACPLSKSFVISTWLPSHAHIITSARLGTMSYTLKCACQPDIACDMTISQAFWVNQRGGTMWILHTETTISSSISGIEGETDHLEEVCVLKAIELQCRRRHSTGCQCKYVSRSCRAVILVQSGLQVQCHQTQLVL